MKKIERAIISVSDKTGLVPFAQALSEFGVEILSTGGTSKLLREAGVKVKDISEFTGFPEMMDGRVKTLHPKVHAGLLYLRDNKDHCRQLEEQNFAPVDLVCVNLYPFEETIANPMVSFDDAIEQIDIGGPTMIRSAAKNMKFVTVVTDAADYEPVIAAMKANGGATTEALRLQLGQKVFARTASYDAAIARYLADHSADNRQKPLVVTASEGTTLRYGENPHQKAAFYLGNDPAEAAIAYTEVLHGKAMSYNNYVDGNAALEAVKELSGQPGVAIIKHTNPCGYAVGATLADAFEAAWAGDPVSSYGSVIAVTEKVDMSVADCLKGRFIEALIAPDFDADALETLKTRSKNIRLLKLMHPMSHAKAGQEVKQVTGGWLVQDRDTGLVDDYKLVTKAAFPDAKKALAEFGMKACKHVKSNAIIIVYEYKPAAFAVLGMGAGQPNRVDSVRKLAVPKCRENMAAMFGETVDYKADPKAFEQKVMSESVLVSDAFFPFADNIQFADEAGIRFIIEPGGSMRDADVIAACDEKGIAMLFTGMRHFKH